MVIEKQEVALRTDNSGVLRVGESRVTLDTVIYQFNEGASPEEIVLRYPALQLADVYSVIAYYLGHRKKLDAYLQERERQSEEMERELRARPEVQAIRERLLARKANLDKSS